MQNLRKLLHEYYLLDSTISTLHWDQETCLPEDASEFRGKQISYLSKLAHEKFTSSEMAEAIDHLKKQAETQGLSEKEQVILREVEKDYHKLVKVPSSLVERKSELTVTTHHAWIKARQANNFKIFAPYLKELVEVSLEEANYIDSNRPAYEVMLESHEPGMDTAKIDSLFANLKNFLVDFWPQVFETQKDNLKLTGPFPVRKQQEIANQMIKEIGFDFQRGRVDFAVHPFCIELGPQDVRITTRYNENHLEGMYSTIHECGHALYGQGLDKDYFETPLGHPTSIGIHESQSRFWEVFIGKSQSFLQRYFPLLKASFPQLKNWSIDEFYQALNWVHPNLIRIDSDEVTYHLHIILRYELEKAIFSRQVAVEDLADLWNEKIKEYLGLEVSNHREGVLQDIHWSQAIFAYFPTYTIGSIYAAQLLATLQKIFPKWEETILEGKFYLLKNWLQDHIYQAGRRMNGAELIEEVSQEKLTEEYLVKYLQEKWQFNNHQEVFKAS